LVGFSPQETISAGAPIVTTNQGASHQSNFNRNSKGKTMTTLATLEQLQAHLGLTAGVDEARLLHALTAATIQIERYAGRRFLPHLEQRTQDVDPRQPDTLLLDDDLLRLDSVTDGDGSAIDISDVLTIPDDDRPIYMLKLRDGRAFVWETLPNDAVTVGGLWGWHDHPSRAWRSSGDSVQDNPLSAAGTTINVTDADGADVDGQLPRFQVGQLLRIDEEMLAVLAVDATNNTLTVQRAANGSAAATHPQNTAIEVYKPPVDLNMLALRWAAWLYHTPDDALVNGVPGGLLAETAILRRLRVGD
jgi:hypothetical protein